MKSRVYYKLREFGFSSTPAGVRRFEMIGPGVALEDSLYPRLPSCDPSGITSEEPSMI